MILASVARFQQLIVPEIIGFPQVVFPENLNVKCFQYVDNTTIYNHVKTSDLNKCSNISIDQQLSCLNNDKTKVIVVSTKGVEYITLVSMILPSPSMVMN